MSFYERWALGIGGFLLLSSGAITTAREADTEPFAEALGAGFGVVLIALVLALVLRFAYVRIRGGERPVVSPWLVLTAGAVALFVNLALSANDVQDYESSLQRHNSHRGVG